MGLNEWPAVDVVGSHAAVVRTLRRGVAGMLGESQRTAALEERVLLLEAEQRILIGVLVRDRDQLASAVGGVGGHVGKKNLAQHKQIVPTPNRVRAGEHRLQDTIRRLPRRLAGTG